MWGIVTTLLTEAITYLKDTTKSKAEKEAKINEMILELSKAGFENAQGQLKINEAEAANPNRKWFTWREACGWVCVVSLLWDSFCPTVFSLVNGIANIFLSSFKNPFVLPTYDTSTLITILIGMLGLGAYHTAENISQKKWLAKTQKYK